MTDYKDGWIAHAQPWATPPTMTALSYFGLGLEDGKGFIDTPFTQDINEIESYGVYYPSLDVGDANADKIGIRFQPVNGLFLYWFFGKASGTTTKTVVNMDGATRKPRIAIWQQSANKKYHHYAVLFGSLNIDWGQNRLAVSMVGKGQVHGASALSPTFTHPTSIQTPFLHIDSMTWNAGAVKPLRFQLQLQHRITPIPSNAGYYQEINEFATMFGVYTIQFTGATGEDMVADFQAGTTRAFVWKIKKADDVTKYIQLTCNCKIVSLIPSRDYGKPVVYSAVMKCENFSCEIVDGIADAFYGL